MKEDKQITDLDYLPGKTVARAMWLNYRDEIGIVFDDGTFLYIDIDQWQEGSDLSIIESPDFDVAKKLGLLTEAEIAEHEATEEAKRKAMEFREREEKVRVYEKLRRELGKGD